MDVSGRKANQLLGRVLENRLGPTVTSNDLTVSFREDTANSTVAIRDALAELARAGRPTAEDALRSVAETARGWLSKFQPCLPADLEAKYVASSSTDVPGAKTR